MRDNFSTRVGATRRKRPARTYDELINQPTIERPDDGALCGPWLTTEASPWSWNEGPCRCGGILRWAEAGYVPWHRICDRCGSHWSLHLAMLIPHAGSPAETVVVGYRLPDGRRVATVDDIWLAGSTEDDAIPITEERPAEPPGVLPLLPGDPARDGDLCIIQGRRHQIVPADLIALYDQIRALVRPHHITPEVLQHGAIYGGWATRARFCRG